MALSHDAVQIGITAVIVLMAVLSAGIIWRKKYVRPADFERGIETLRQEFRHSIEAAQTASKRARTVSESLASVIRPIDSTVTDLDTRLARLEEHADATAAFMAASQKRASEENERIAVRLEGLEQRQMAPATHMERLDQSLQALKFLLTNQAVAEAKRRDEDRNSLIEAVNVQLMNTQAQLDQLVSRLELGEKARSDLGTLISLFVKQLKRVNLNSAQTAVRVADLEGQLRLKLKGLEERLGSIHERENRPSTKNVEGMAGDATPNADHRAASLENGGEMATDFERPPMPTEDLPNGASVERESD